MKAEYEKLYKMKQDDWLLACKEIDSLKAELKEARELIREIYQDDYLWTEQSKETKLDWDERARKFLELK